MTKRELEVEVEMLREALERVRFCYAQGVAPGSDWSVIAGFMDQLAHVALQEKAA